MREHANGVALPQGWRNLPLDELVALADRVGATYWIDEEILAKQVRQAIRAAGELAYYRPPTSPRVDVATDARQARATEMRDAGIAWTTIAAELNYASDASACSSVGNYCERTGRDFPDPPLALRAPSRARGEKAYLMRMNGTPWRVIAEATGYKDAGGAMSAMQRYCAMMGLEEPVTINMDGSPRKGRTCSLSTV